MTSKLALIQKLLLDRDEVVMLYHGEAFCSCGISFEDMSDIENHLVQKHEKLPDGTKRKNSLKEILLNFINAPVNCDSSFLQLELPPKVVAVCLEEDSIDGGLIRDYTCNECSISCWSFKTLKDHYCRQHPGTWASPATIKDTSRILFRKPSRQDANQAPKDWSYRFYCPLPGCKYHINQHTITSHESKKPAKSDKFFPTLSLLKQHYLKLHAFKSHVCERCNAAFSTGVFLRRHKKAACGRSFTCSTCQTTFGALENLQTHCRRKGHCLPKEFSSGSSLKAKGVSNKPAPQPLAKHQGKFIKIAPMPSLTMTAAIALSELSTSSGTKSRKHDPLMGATDLKTCSATAQTSPRGDDNDLPQVEVDEATSKRDEGCSGIPKLGEIEQFSTETQTDDLELLLKPSAGAAEDAFTIEAQTQFDLDDILCSNYTQTALFDISMDQSTSTNNMNSIETQTMLITADDLVHMETQTMSMLFENEVNS